MANPLDWAARAILQINGMSPEEIKQKARQVKHQKPKKPMPKANTSAPAPQKKQPVTRRTRINGRVKPGTATRSNQAGQAKPVRQGPRTSNVKQQVEIGPRSAQKPDGPIGPNSRYTPKSKQQPDGKAPSKNVRKLQQAAKTQPKSSAPKPAARPGPGTSSRPLGTADVGPKGEVGKLGQRTGMKGNSPKPQLNAPKPGVKAPAPKPAAKPSAVSRLGSAARKAADWVAGNTPEQQAKPVSRLAEFLGGDRPKPKVSAGDAAAARAVRAVNASKVLNVGRLGGVATGLGIANAIDDSRLTEAQKAKKYEVVDPNRKERVLNNLLNGGPKAKDAPKPKPNPKSQAKAPSAAQQATDKRDKKKLF